MKHILQKAKPGDIILLASDFLLVLLVLCGGISLAVAAQTGSIKAMLIGMTASLGGLLLYGVLKTLADRRIFENSTRNIDD